MREEKDIIIYKAGCMVILTLALCYMLSSIFFLAGFPLSSYLFPLSFAISGVCVLWKFRRADLFSIAIALLAMGLSIAIMIPTADYSLDGNAYHQGTIAALADGWNPFRSPQNPDVSVWGIHYARAFETISAAITLTFGHLEWGRAVNAMLISGTALMAYPALRSLGLRTGAAVAITLLLTANPVGIEQVFTYCNDFPKYYLTVVAIILLIRIFRHPTIRPESMLCSVLILGIGTKFNAAPDLAITMLFAIVLAYVRRRSMIGATLVAIGAVALIAGTLLFGYNPYVTNTITAGHPLYPLLGENAIDIMTGNTPDIYLSGNRFTNFFLSLTSSQMRLFTELNDPLGGFTLLMPLLLLLSVAVFIAGWSRIAPVWKAAAITVLLSCFIFEQSWWARYIAQLWLLPVIAAVCAARLPHNRIQHFLLTCLCVFGLAAGIMATINTRRSIFVTRYRNGIFDAAREKGELILSGTTPLIERRAAEENVRIKVISPDSSLWKQGYVYYSCFRELEPRVRVLMPVEEQREMRCICDW